jgi:hypothetical protein
MVTWRDRYMIGPAKDRGLAKDRGRQRIDPQATLEAVTVTLVAT